MLEGAKGLVNAAWKSIRNRGPLWALLSLLSFHLLANWVWLSSNVTLVGWDQPSHLWKSLVCNDLLRQLNPTPLFQAIVLDEFRPPLLFFSIAVFHRLFGLSTDVALMSNSPYLALLLFSTYGIGKRIYDKSVGLLAAFLVSTFPLLFSLSRTSYFDFPLAALVSLSIYLLLLSNGFRDRRYSLLLAISLGLGMLMKQSFIAFLIAPLAFVVVRSDILAHVVPRDMRSFSNIKLATLSSVPGLLLALLLYLPNEEWITEQPLGRWCFIIWWLLFWATIFSLTRRSSPEANFGSAILIASSLASLWYLPRAGFLRRLLEIMGGKKGMEPQFAKLLDLQSHLLYPQSMIGEQISPLYFIFFLLAIASLIWQYKEARRRGLSEGLWLLILWVSISYILLSLSVRKSPRYTAPLLPPIAIITSRGLLRISGFKVRMAFISLLICAGAWQFFVLSYDALAWIPERATFNLPIVGRGNLFAQGGYLRTPNRGATDSGYWILPDVLEEAAGSGLEGDSGKVRFALLIETPQINGLGFRYLAYGNYPQITMQRFGSGEGAPSPQEQLFAADYVLFKSEANEALSTGKQRALAVVKGTSPFDVVFDLVKRYDLPNGEEAYLYRKRYYMRGGYNPEDYRGMGEWLSDGNREGDGMVIVPPEQVEVLARYLWGDMGIYPLPREGASVEEMEEELVEIVSGQGRIFGIFWDEGGVEGVHLVEGWLSEHGYRAWERWYGAVRLVIYSTSPEEVGVYRPLGVRLGDKITLDGYRLMDRDAGAGDIVRLTLHWRAEGEIGEDYKVFVHLLDEEGGLVAQRDSEPVGGMRPTSGWGEGEEVMDNYGVVIPQGVPAGEYEIVVGMYDPESGERLPIMDEGGVVIGDKVSLGMVEVVDG